MNLTAFFRENHHSEFLAKTACRPVHAAQSRRTQPVDLVRRMLDRGGALFHRVMVLAEQQAPAERMGIPADLAKRESDIIPNVSARRPAGSIRWRRWRICQRRHLRTQKEKVRNRAGAKVRDTLRRYIAYARINLMEPLMSKCRTSSSAPQCHHLFRQNQRNGLVEVCRCPGDRGYLIVGHSESLYQVTDQFQTHQQHCVQEGALMERGRQTCCPASLPGFDKIPTATGIPHAICPQPDTAG